MKNRIFISLLVISSAFILIADDLIFKKFGIEFSNNFGYSNTPNFIYSISQSISSILLLGTFLTKSKPYKIAYLFVVYVQLLQLSWVFFSNDYNSYKYFNIGAFGFTILFALLIIVINKAIKDEKSKTQQIDYLKSMIELQIILRDKRK
ncbi:MAG: hypothetical protein QM535_09565 [Limnohabitans sp.]|nr:hypothetical protein [Limnohabitans sp.]